MRVGKNCHTKEEDKLDRDGKFFLAMRQQQSLLKKTVVRDKLLKLVLLISSNGKYIHHYYSRSHFITIICLIFDYNKFVTYLPWSSTNIYICV